MLSTYDMLLRLFVAALLGSIIGWERERRQWTAGLRTHMMVSLGSALIMLVSMYGFNDVIGKPGISLDPSRVAAQVVSGIGFLGAGTIFFLRNEIVKGLTTAAGLWTVAAIGLAVGGGLYIEAVATTLIAFIILAVFKPFENRFFKKNRYRKIRMLLAQKHVDFDAIEVVLNEHNIPFKELSLSAGDGSDEILITIQKQFTENENVLKVIAELKNITGVTGVDFLS
ncbi:putative Mg2+ transporter-C (MgtC) family protein [Mucilaginibacter pineti]|uniref:Putative Mg2+ transporter-C (MgtC) family protein n=1 Tax=Mucilaginibacter pineti TaxID=1391627 RepID=A0A1G6TQJ2_9SPHI|nr:MgtC/SapB family protein [Mucilaginibacter pineti]SDD31378.1 putative Mg2+ transporter-C (MgtC) family protein [Mucilaginibacter pineti]